MLNNARLASAFLLLLCASCMLLSSGCGSEQAGASTAPASGSSSDPIAKATSEREQRPKLRPGAKTVVLSKAGDKPFDKTFDDLRFNMTVGEKFKRSMLTKGILDMNGEKIRIRGYILPTPQKHGIQQFVLVRDNQECCFGPGAALYDCILVEMKKGNTADFTIRPIAVEGKFNVREFNIDGRDLAIYQMDGESAQ
jgi:hypothetical protein